MKKFFFTFAALLAIAAVSCQREIAVPEELNPENENQTEVTGQGEGVVVFSASLPGATASKTVIGEADGESKYTPLWTDTDQIIVNGVKSAPAERIGNGASAKFTVEGVGAPYLALAPGSLDVAAAFAYHDDNTYDYVVPGAGRPQTYTAGTYDPNNAVIAAYSTGNTLAFRHLCAYYKITVSGGSDDDNIRYIYIRQGDGSNLAGTWTATFVSENGISIAPKGTLSSVITLDCGEDGVAHGTSMIVAVPAYNFANGLIITLKDVNGHFCSYSMASTKTQFADNAGTVFEFNPVFNPGPGTINNAADWEAFANAFNNRSSKPYDLYKWIGNGTVKLGADFSAESLTRINNWPAGYTFDGQNHIITRNEGTGGLFRSINGTVKNLSVSGSIDINTTSTAYSTIGALADSLYTGGKISNCTNNTNISVNTQEVQRGSRVGGIVGIMTGGEIDRCINNGSLTASVNCSNKDIYNLQIGGIVGQVDGTDATSGDAVLSNCTNKGVITADPVSSSAHVYAIYYAGIGGIAGWLRGNANSFLLYNCDNSGKVFYSAEHVTDPTGTKAYPISVGGIVGIAGDHAGTAGYDSSIGDNGLDVTIRFCDNSGTVHNCGINYAMTGNSTKRVYTGGIAGSLVGTSAKKAKLASCRSTGDILTYDLTGTGTSARPLYCQVAGGLIGYGGYVAIDSCKVNCTIGNGKRQSCAIGGAIGHTMAPFTADRDTVWFNGYFTMVDSQNNDNSSAFATVVTKWKSTAVNPAPSITGSSISNSYLGANLYYYTTITSDLSDRQADCQNNSTALGIEQAVRGHGFTDSIVPTNSETITSAL